MHKPSWVHQRADLTESRVQLGPRQTYNPEHHVFLSFSRLTLWSQFSSFIWPSNAAFDLHRADRLQFDQMPYKTQMLWVVFSECFLVSPSPVSPPFSPLPLTAIHLVVVFVTVCSAQLGTNFSSSVRRDPFSRNEQWCKQCPTLRSSSAPQMTSGAPVNTPTKSCPVSCLTSLLRVYFFKDMVNLAASVSSSWALVWYSSHYFACGLLWFNSRHLPQVYLQNVQFCVLQKKFSIRIQSSLASSHALLICSIRSATSVFVRFQFVAPLSFLLLT